MKFLKIIPLLFLSLLFSCEKENPNYDSPSSDIPESGWLIPTEEIWNSQHAMDFIPSIDNPSFSQILNVSYIENDDLVLIFQDGENVRVYPHKIIKNHEIVNDNIGDTFFAITYCPLTGSGLNWNREIDGKVTEFGVSGLLYRSNLIPYDRNTISFWSQMLNKCVNGEQIKTEPVILPLVETTFSTAKKVYPAALVLQYEQNSYKQETETSYPGTSSNRQLQKSTSGEYPLGERMFGVIIRDNAVLFPYTTFGDSASVIQGYFNKREVIVAGSLNDHYAIAFLNTTSNPLLKFSAVSGELPIVMKDNEGNRWDMFGNAVEGPMKGAKLDVALSYVAYYWGWKNFYPDLIIADNQHLN